MLKIEKKLIITDSFISGGEDLDKYNNENISVSGWDINLRLSYVYFLPDMNSSITALHEFWLS